MIKLRSYAKINLYLDVGEKLNNGYHCIETIFQTINLFDEIKIEKIDKPIYHIECNNPEIPVDKTSIVYRAIEIIMKGKNYGVAVYINKKIPIAAGLGGGSSNVATILLGISKLYKLDVNSKKMQSIATSLGMDVPFFLERGTVYAIGRGEILSPLDLGDMPLHLILVNPGFEISTKWAYQAFDKANADNFKKPYIGIMKMIETKSIVSLPELSKYIYNSFDSIICKQYPIIKEIKDTLFESGAISATISGSGPTVYGVMENRSKANEVYNKMKNKFTFVCRAMTVKAREIYV